MSEKLTLSSSSTPILESRLDEQQVANLPFVIQTPSAFQVSVQDQRILIRDENQDIVQPWLLRGLRLDCFWHLSWGVRIPSSTFFQISVCQLHSKGKYEEKGDENAAEIAENLLIKSILVSERSGRR